MWTGAALGRYSQNAVATITLFSLSSSSFSSGYVSPRMACQWFLKFWSERSVFAVHRAYAVAVIFVVSYNREPQANNRSPMAYNRAPAAYGF